MEELNDKFYHINEENIIEHCDELINSLNYSKIHLNFNDFISSILVSCDIDETDMTNQEVLTEKFKNKILEIKIFRKMLINYDLIYDIFDDENHKSYDDILKNLIMTIGNIRYSLLYLRQSLISIRPSFDCSMTNDQLINSINIKDIEKNSDLEKLIRYTLNYLELHNYRKFEGFIYEAIYYNGKFTNAWKQKYEIAVFVHIFIEKDIDNNPMWALLYGKSLYTPLIKYLLECNDSQFPIIDKNRYYLSFRNGVYDIKRHLFYDNSKNELSPNIVASKFFDKEFKYIEDLDLQENWYDIETKSVQLLLDPQYHDNKDYHEICKTAYILIGRMLYELGEFDDWQVIPFFKGLANTGKSTILKDLIQKFYEFEDVGILSNDCEASFPIQSLETKKIFIALDIDAKFKLPQMQFQSMVSGEEVSVNRKFLTAKSKVWKIPGAMSGNELFGYRDNAGSLGRRVIVFQFGHLLTNDQLKNDVKGDLDREMPTIIQKCNLAYRYAIKHYSRTNLWEYLPKFFVDFRDNLLEQTNSLIDFMNNGNLVYEENNFMTKEEFISQYNLFCKENQCLQKKITSDYYCHPFNILSKVKKIKIEMKKNPTINNIKYVGTFVLGIDLLRLDNLQEENNDN